MMPSATIGAKARAGHSPARVEPLSLSLTRRMAVWPSVGRYYPGDGTEQTVKETPGESSAAPPRRWRPGTGIYVVAPLQPSLTTLIGDIQVRFDPKLARLMPPHITIIGSSGAGPLAPATTVEELQMLLEPIADSTPPLTLQLGRPVRFMQTDIIVLPLNPHGPLRDLHERIRRSGLTYARPRFAFTPHITLSFYRELSPAERRALLALRVDEPAEVVQIECSLSNDPQPARHLLTLPLRGRPLRMTP
jgi:2'-5' RNA ligase